MKLLIMTSQKCYSQANHPEHVLGSEVSPVISEHCILQMSISGCYIAFRAIVMTWGKKHPALFSMQLHSENWLHTNFLLGQWQVSQSFLHGLTEENIGPEWSNKVKWRNRKRKNIFSRLIKQGKTNLCYTAGIL